MTEAISSNIGNFFYFSSLLCFDKDNASKIIFISNADELGWNLRIFLFYDLLACNIKAKIFIALIAQLRSQFNHIFSLLLSMPHFKSINFH